MAEHAQFKGRVVAITGAGRGLGAAYARLLASRGAQVVVHDAGVDKDGHGSDPTVAAAVVDEIAHSGALRPNTLVAHTAGASGVAVLAPLAELGALPLAIHPAMTFVGTADDTTRLRQACFGVTAADEDDISGQGQGGGVHRLSSRVRGGLAWSRGASSPRDPAQRAAPRQIET